MLQRPLKHTEKHYVISEGLIKLLYFLMVGFIFELYWEIYSGNTPLNNWILIAYLLPPAFSSLLLADQLTKKTYDEKESIKNLMKSRKEGIKTVKIFAFSVSVLTILHFNKLMEIYF